MKKYWFLLLLPLLLLIWWGVGRSDSGPLVHFSPVSRMTIESTVTTNGKAEPAQSAAARAEDGGVVRTIDVKRGDRVAAGQTLITLDSASAQSDLAAAEAREQEAQAELRTLNQGGRAGTVANIQDSIASATAAVETAQRNYDALRRLQSQQAATALQVQDGHDALVRAQLQLQAAQNQRRTLVTPTDKTVAEAKVRDAAAAVALAKHRLALASVVSPLTGTVYQFDLRVGAYLQPGGLVAMIGRLTQIKVTVYVDEPDLGRVEIGMPVRITWDARPGQIWWGRVDQMPTEIVALGTRSVGEVVTLVDNPGQDLLPGVTVNATIISKVAKDALAMPKAALRTLNGANGVFRLKGNSLLWTPVQTGVSDVNSVQILSGLNQGDQVADRVVDPSDAEIRNGMHIRVDRSQS